MKYFLPFIALCLLSACSSSSQYSKLKFPERSSATTEPTFVEIKDTCAKLNPVLGAFPPRFTENFQSLTAYVLWTNAIISAEKMKESSTPSEELYCILIDLYRFGHNMDVDTCGRKAVATIDEAVAAYPDSVEIYFTAARFYSSVSNAHAKQMEEYYLKLRGMLGTEVNKEVEYGLAIAYFKEFDKEKAAAQIEHYLSIYPDDERMQKFKLLVEGVDEGK